MQLETEVALARVEQFKRDRWPYVIGHVGATGAVIGVAWPIADQASLLWFGAVHHLTNWLLALAFFLPLRSGRETRIPLWTYAGTALCNATLSCALLFDLTAARELDFALAVGIVLFAGAAGAFVTLGGHPTLLRVALISGLLPYAVITLFVDHVAIALGVTFFLVNVGVAGVWKTSTGNRELISLRIDEADRALLAEKAADTDPLTGLANRRGLGRLDGMSLAAGAAVIYVDLNKFKAINDTYGHNVGDEILRVVARRLVDVVAVNEVVARLGGDEFLVIALTDETGAIETVVERICQQLHEPIRLEDGDLLDVTAAIGVATTSEPVLELQGLLRESDRAMYRSRMR